MFFKDSFEFALEENSDLSAVQLKCNLQCKTWLWLNERHKLGLLCPKLLSITIDHGLLTFCTAKTKRTPVNSWRKKGSARSAGLQNLKLTRHVCVTSQLVIEFITWMKKAKIFVRAMQNYYQIWHAAKTDLLFPETLNMASDILHFPYQHVSVCMWVIYKLMLILHKERFKGALYSPRHGAGAGGPAGTIRTDRASPWVRAAVPLIAGRPVSAAIGAVWSLSAAASHIPVGTGALLGQPPPGVSVIPLLPIPTAQGTLTTSPSSGTRWQSRAGTLPARATPTWGLALGACLVALGGLAMAPVRPVPLGRAAAGLPSAFSPLLPIFARLPWAAALLAARWGCGGSSATNTGRRLYLGGEHQLPTFRVTFRLDLTFRWGGWWGSLLLALSRAPLLSVFAALFLVPTFPIPRVSNFIRVLGLFSGVSVPPVLPTASFSADIVPVVVWWGLQAVPAPPLRRSGRRWVRESVRVGADVIVLHQRLHRVDTRRRRIAEGKIFGSRCRRGFPIKFGWLMPFASWRRHWRF